MADPAAVRAAEAFQQQLQAANAKTILQMTRQWGNVEAALESEIAALAAQVDQLAQEGPVPQWRIYELERYQSLLAQIQGEVTKFMQWAIVQLQDEAQKAQLQARIDAAQMLGIQAGGSTDILQAMLDKLGTQAAEKITAVAQGGQPLHQILGRMNPLAITGLTNELVAGAALGRGPRETARRMIKHGIATGLNHALLVARDQQIRNYREASRNAYEQSGLVYGYMRLAARNRRTCMACIALDGTVYQTSQLMALHPQDRCSMIPLVVGRPFPKIEKALDWFKRQPDEIQREMMGPGRFKLWKETGFDLRRMVTVKPNPTWGPNAQETTLKSLKVGGGMDPDDSLFRIQAPDLEKAFVPAGPKAKVVDLKENLPLAAEIKKQVGKAPLPFAAKKAIQKAIESAEQGNEGLTITNDAGQIEAAVSYKFMTDSPFLRIQESGFSSPEAHMKALVELAKVAKEKGVGMEALVAAGDVDQHVDMGWVVKQPIPPGAKYAMRLWPDHIDGFIKDPAEFGKAQKLAEATKQGAELFAAGGVPTFKTGYNLDGQLGIPYKAAAEFTDDQIAAGKAEFGKDGIPPLPEIYKKHQGAGLILIDPVTGKVVFNSPTNEFGGYKNTVPKGTQEPGHDLQHTAMKEAFEETGFTSKIIGYLGDYEKTTSNNRFYVGLVTGGAPWGAHWESQAVGLADAKDLLDLLDSPADKEIINEFLGQLDQVQKKWGNSEDGLIKGFGETAGQKAAEKWQEFDQVNDLFFDWQEGADLPIGDLEKIISFGVDPDAKAQLITEIKEKKAAAKEAKAKAKEENKKHQQTWEAYQTAGPDFLQFAPTEAVKAFSGWMKANGLPAGDIADVEAIYAVRREAKALKAPVEKPAGFETATKADLVADLVKKTGATKWKLNQLPKAEIEALYGQPKAATFDAAEKGAQKYYDAKKATQEAAQKAQEARENILAFPPMLRGATKAQIVKYLVDETGVTKWKIQQLQKEELEALFGQPKEAVHQAGEKGAEKYYAAKKEKAASQAEKDEVDQITKARREYLAKTVEADKVTKEMIADPAGVARWAGFSGSLGKYIPGPYLDLAANAGHSKAHVASLLEANFPELIIKGKLDDFLNDQEFTLTPAEMDAVLKEKDVEGLLNFVTALQEFKTAFGFAIVEVGIHGEPYAAGVNEGTVFTKKPGAKAPPPKDQAPPPPPAEKLKPKSPQEALEAYYKNEIPANIYKLYGYLGDKGYVDLMNHTFEKGDGLGTYLSNGLKNIDTLNDGMGKQFTWPELEAMPVDQLKQKMEALVGSIDYGQLNKADLLGMLHETKEVFEAKQKEAELAVGQTLPDDLLAKIKPEPEPAKTAPAGEKYPADGKELEDLWVEGALPANPFKLYLELGESKYQLLNKETLGLAVPLEKIKAAQAHFNKPGKMAWLKGKANYQIENLAYSYLGGGYGEEITAKEFIAIVDAVNQPPGQAPAGIAEKYPDDPEMLKAMYTAGDISPDGNPLKVYLELGPEKYKILAGAFQSTMFTEHLEKIGQLQALYSNNPALFADFQTKPAEMVEKATADLFGTTWAEEVNKEEIIEIIKLGQLQPGQAPPPPPAGEKDIGKQVFEKVQSGALPKNFLVLYAKVGPDAFQAFHAHLKTINAQAGSVELAEKAMEMIGELHQGLADALYTYEDMKNYDLWMIKDILENNGPLVFQPGTWEKLDLLELAFPNKKSFIQPPPGKDPVDTQPVAGKTALEFVDEMYNAGSALKYIAQIGPAGAAAFKQTLIDEGKYHFTITVLDQYDLMKKDLAGIGNSPANSWDIIQNLPASSFEKIFQTISGFKGGDLADSIGKMTKDDWLAAFADLDPANQKGTGEIPAEKATPAGTEKPTADLEYGKKIWDLAGNLKLPMGMGHLAAVVHLKGMKSVSEYMKSQGLDVSEWEAMIKKIETLPLPAGVATMSDLKKVKKADMEAFLKGHGFSEDYEIDGLTKKEMEQFFDHHFPNGISGGPEIPAELLAASGEPPKKFTPKAVTFDTEPEPDLPDAPPPPPPKGKATLEVTGAETNYLDFIAQKAGAKMTLPYQTKGINKAINDIKGGDKGIVYQGEDGSIVGIMSLKNTGSSLKLSGVSFLDDEVNAMAVADGLRLAGDLGLPLELWVPDPLKPKYQAWNFKVKDSNYHQVTKDQAPADLVKHTSPEIVPQTSKGPIPMPAGYDTIDQIKATPQNGGMTKGALVAFFESQTSIPSSKLNELSKDQLVAFIGHGNIEKPVEDLVNKKKALAEKKALIEAFAAGGPGAMKTSGKAFKTLEAIEELKPGGISAADVKELRERGEALAAEERENTPFLPRHTNRPAPLAPEYKPPKHPDFPADPEKLRVVKSLGGSTGAELVEDPETGKRYIRKRGGGADTEGHLRNEAVVDGVYQAAGYAVPRNQIYETPRGPVKIAEFIEGESLATALRNASPAERRNIEAQVKAGFAMDALVANWDVLGASNDNVLVDKNGKVWRIDNGGGLGWRAMGNRKKGDEWDDYPLALWTMREGGSGAGANNKAMFGKMDYFEIVDQMRDLVAKGPELLASLPPEDRPRVWARLENMRDLVDLSDVHRKDKFEAGYVDTFGEFKMKLRSGGVSDTLPKKMERRSGGTSVSVYDEKGQRYDGLRDGGQAYREIKEFMEKQGLDPRIMTEWAKDQGGNSWNEGPQAVKYFMYKSRPDDEGTWFMFGLNGAKEKYDNFVRRYGKEKFERSVVAFKALTHEMLSQMDFERNHPEQGFIELVRTEQKNVMTMNDLRPDWKTAIQFPRSMAESGSIYTTVRVNGNQLTMYRVPYHRIWGTYWLSKLTRPHDNGGSGFLGDGENEFVFDLSGLDCWYVGTDNGGNPTDDWWEKLYANNPEARP